jgi:hypothetical protein
MDTVACTVFTSSCFPSTLFLNIAWCPLTYFALGFANEKEVYDSDRNFFRSGREKTIKAILQLKKNYLVPLDDKMNNLITVYRTRFTLWDIYLKKKK